MTIKVNFDPEEFVLDFRRYLFHRHLKAIKALFGLFLLWILLLILDNLIDLFPIIRILKGGALGALIGLFFVEAIYIINSLIKINNAAKHPAYNIDSITFNKRSIDFTCRKGHYSAFWNSYNYALVIKNTVFIVSKSKKENPIRINKNEVGEGGFKFTLDEIKKRLELRYY